eukprot:Skav228942  [mRNA]  locus=scaffold2181:373837:377040:- [translate_table: standard]
MNDAFPYFYFSDVMQTLSGLAPSFLTAGRNAKTDFPEDYKAYFEDDVCKNFSFPRVKLIFEPWRPPLRSAVLATRKTAMLFQEQQYMLGCFFPVDELELGFTHFSTGLPFIERPDLPRPPPLAWYTAAFDQLPNAMVILDNAGGVMAQNQLAHRSGEVLPAVIRMTAAEKADPSVRYWHLRRLLPELQSPLRIWLWRAFDESPLLNICWKPIEADVMERAQLAAEVLSS